MKVDVPINTMPAHISKVVAKGPYVVLVLTDGNEIALTRKDALLRAQQIAGLDKISMDLVEAVILAANEAKINETGEGYTSQALNHMLNSANAEYKRRIR